MNLPCHFSKCSLLLFCLTSGHVSALNIGLCPTPLGTVGTIPCDLGCTGSAILSASSSLVSTYSQYASSFSRSQSNTTQCQISDKSASISYINKINKTKNKLTSEITHNGKEISKTIGQIAISERNNRELFSNILNTHYVNIFNAISSSAKQILSIKNVLDMNRRTKDQTLEYIINSMGDVDSRNSSIYADNLNIYRMENDFRNLKYSRGVGFSSALKLNDMETVSKFEDYLFSKSADIYTMKSDKFYHLINTKLDESDLMAINLHMTNIRNYELLYY